jgi:hypothetical protein
MKSKTFLVSVIALFAIVFAISAVSASTVTINDVKVNGLSVVSGITSGAVSDTVPVEVSFTANEDASDVRVKVYIEGYKSEISETTDRFQVINGSKYIKRFTLKLPSSMDLDNLTEDLSLIVRVSAKEQDPVEQSYALKMQKDLYSLSILSIDAPGNVAAGSVIPVDVVIQDNGFTRLDNTYVRVSIPELGVERNVYYGDLKPIVDENHDSIEDAVSKRIYLNLPRNAISGIYNIIVEAYNYDATSVAKQKIVVSDTETGVLTSSNAKTISAGETATFDLLLVNPSTSMAVYTITPVEAKGLLVDISEPIVSVSADSSKTVQISVKATDSAQEGTYLVTVNVNSESGPVKQASFSLNVEKSKAVTANNSVLVLTIVLGIIFVVLLVILIVLLTRKPAQTEEFGETSYY